LLWSFKAVRMLRYANVAIGFRERKDEDAAEEEE